MWGFALAATVCLSELSASLARLQCPCPELGYFDEAPEDGLHAGQELVSRLAALSLAGGLLGAGDVSRHYPTDLDAYYRDDQEWRVMM